MVTHDDFAKLDMRVGTIITAEKVENTDKLLKLMVDCGENELPKGRQIISGIAEFYIPEQLVGKQIVVLTNLEPRTFKGAESQGMLLAADENGKPTLLTVDSKVANGSVIK